MEGCLGWFFSHYYYYTIIPLYYTIIPLKSDYKGNSSEAINN